MNNAPIAHKLTIAEVEANEGQDAASILEDSLFDMRLGVPALCDECGDVELDGHCRHGFPSLAIAMGVI